MGLTYCFNMALSFVKVQIRFNINGQYVNKYEWCKKDNNNDYNQ